MPSAAFISTVRCLELGKITSGCTWSRVLSGRGPITDPCVHVNTTSLILLLFFEDDVYLPAKKHFSPAIIPAPTQHSKSLGWPHEMKLHPKKESPGWERLDAITSESSPIALGS